MRSTNFMPRTYVARLAVVLSCALVLGLGQGWQGVASAEGLRGRFLDMTNASRNRKGLPDLRMDWKLSGKARDHSIHMARRNRLRHSEYLPRAIRGSWRAWGENVGYTTGALRDLQVAFMRSASHRTNVLNRTFRRVAIGVVREGGKLWVTVMFYG